MNALTNIEGIYRINFTKEKQNMRVTIVTELFCFF